MDGLRERELWQIWMWVFVECANLEYPGPEDGMDQDEKSFL